MSKKVLKIIVMENNQIMFPDDFNIGRRIFPEEFPNIYEKYKDVTFDEFSESIDKILAWMMKDEIKFIHVDLEKRDEELGRKEMTIKEIEDKLWAKGTNLTELIEKELGYKIKITEEVGKHEASRSDKE